MYNKLMGSHGKTRVVYKAKADPRTVAGEPVSFTTLVDEYEEDDE